MLIGYFLHHSDVDALAKVTGLVVNWFSLAAPGLPADVLAARTFAIEGGAIRLSASVGVALFPQDGHTVEALLARADTAMYRAKNAGRGGVMSFSSPPGG